MKKLLAGLGLVAVLFGCATRDERLEQLITYGKFMSQEQKGILTAEFLVSKKYVLPDVMYYFTREPIMILSYEQENLVKKEAQGISPGPVKDSMFYLPRSMHYDVNLEKYLIGMRKDLPANGNSTNIVPFGSYYVALTAHEMGHVYFYLVPDEQKRALFSVFRHCDSMRKDSLEGHPSEYSRDNSIPENADLEKMCNWMRLNEQFAEFFTYRVLDRTYKKGDELFEMKMSSFLEVMENSGFCRK